MGYCPRIPIGSTPPKVSPACPDRIGAGHVDCAGGSRQLSATLTAQLQQSGVRFHQDHDTIVCDASDFYFDDFSIHETTSGKFIYRQVDQPERQSVWCRQTNAEGIYWIDCNGNKLIIERSRILGTLLIVNPGANSCVSNGPINWSPAVAGYPALLVDADTAANADFSLGATNRTLSEKENGVNFNPSGTAHDDFGQDADTNDIYPSEIRGLIAIRTT